MALVELLEGSIYIYSANKGRHGIKGVGVAFYIEPLTN